MAIGAGLTHGVFVFFKAFQQRNVAFMHYRWIMPISFCMSTTEVVVLSLIAVQAVSVDNWWEMIPFILCLGAGGGSGAIVAMWLHYKYLGERHG